MDGIGKGVLLSPGLHLRNVHWLTAPARILQKPFQIMNTLGRGSGSVHHFRPDACEDLHFLFGSGDGHVQPLPAVFSVERSEIQRDLSFLIRTIADAEENHIPLISLDILQILHENRFLHGKDSFFDFRVILQRLGQGVFNHVLLGHAEGDDAYGIVFSFLILQSRHDFSHHRFRFLWIGSGAASSVSGLHILIAHFRFQLSR